MADRQEASEIVIEICQNCKQHSWCTRHDQTRYESTYSACASAIQSACGLTVTKNKDIPSPQIGAFEVSCNGILIFSKIKTGLWPIPQQLAQRVKLFIDDYKAGKDVTKYVNIKDQKYVPPPKKKPQNQYGYMQFEESPQKKKVENQGQSEQQEDNGQTQQEDMQNSSQLQEQKQQNQAHNESQEQKEAEEETNKEQQDNQDQKNENQNAENQEQQ